MADAWNGSVKNWEALLCATVQNITFFAIAVLNNDVEKL